MLLVPRSFEYIIERPMYQERRTDGAPNQLEERQQNLRECLQTPTLLQGDVHIGEIDAQHDAEVDQREHCVY